MNSSETTRALNLRGGLSVASQPDKFAKFFGPPANEVKIGAYDKLAVATDTLPDVYKGRNLYLRDSIDGFVFDNNEWYTTVALPWAYTLQHHLQWNQWRFNHQLATRVPHEGISRLITSSKSQRRAHIIRRGLAFMIEHGFWQTPEGAEQYKRNILGIKQCVQETQNYDVTVAIREADEYEREWQRTKGMLNVPVSKLLQEEIEYYCILQKRTGGLEFLLDKMRKKMMNRRVKPNLIIVPPDFGMYYSHVQVQDTRTQYWSYATNGSLELKEGPAATAVMKEGYILETRMMDVYENAPPVDPFRHTSQVGEHYFLFDQARGESHEGFASHWYDTWVYKEPESDDFVRLKAKELFKAGWRFDSNGNLDRSHYILAQIANGTGDSRSGNYDISYIKKMLSADKGVDMFLYADDNGHYHVMEIMGQMELQWATTNDFKEAGSTALQQMFDPRDQDAALTKVERLMSLVSQSENIPYHSAYLKALMEKNVSRQIDPTTSRITGRLTPQEITKLNGLPPINEMVPNRFGGLDIPDRDRGTMSGLSVPPFINSWPNILTLADLVSKGSGWDDAAARCAEAVSVINRMTRYLWKFMSSSEFLNKNNQSDWFQVRNEETAAAPLFENLLHTRRDGVFLAIMPESEEAYDERRSLLFADEGSEFRSSDPSFLIRDNKSLFTTLTTDANHRAVLDPARRDIIDAANKITDLNSRDQFYAGLNSLIQQVFCEKDADQSKEVNGVDEKQCIRGLKRLWKSVFTLSSLFTSATTDQFNDLIQKVKDLVYLVPGSAYTDAPKERKSANHQKKTQDALNFVNSVLMKTPVTPEESEAIKAPDTWTRFPPEVTASLITLDVGTRPASKTYKDLEVLKNLWRAARKDFLELARMPDAYPGAQFESIVKKYDSDPAATLNLVGAPKSPPSTPTPADVIAQRDKALLSLKAFIDATGYDESNGSGGTNKVFNNSYADLVKSYIPGTKGTPAEPVVELDFSKKSYRKALWLRAPLSSSKTFLQTSAMAPYPMALPSDPSRSHLSPLNSIIGGEKLRNFESLPQYANVSSKQQTFANTVWAKGMTKANAKAPAPQMRSGVDNVGSYYSQPGDQANQLIGALMGNEKDPRAPRGASVPERYLEYDEYPGMDTGGTGKRVGDERQAFYGRTDELYEKTHTRNFVHRFMSANHIPNILLRVCTQTFMACRNTLDQWMDWHDCNILLLYSICAERPWITHETYDVPYMVGGYETGATFYGHSDFILGDDVVSKIHYGNFTFYSKAQVYESKNVLKARNVFSAAYVRGGGVEPYVSRTQFDHHSGRHAFDMLVKLLPYREMHGTDCINPKDITGAFDIPDANPAFENDRVPHLSSDPYYNTVWDLKRFVKNANTTDKIFTNEPLSVNSITFWGHQFFYNRRAGEYNIVHENTGHFGRTGNQRGAASIRNGGDRMFPPEPNWGTYRLSY